MTLTRTNVDEWYYSDTHQEDRDILRQMENRYADAITLNQAFWSEADIDTRFKSGDQTLWSNIYGNLPAITKKQYSFNRIRRVSNMVNGYQRKNRKSIIAVPIENKDNKTADQYTKVLFWTLNKSNAQDCISRAFDTGPVTTGMSLINVWMDFSRDPVSGDINCDHVSYSSFLIDPYFKKQDLSDCNFIWRRQWLSKMQLKAIFKKKTEDIDYMNPRGNQDGKFQFMAESYNYAMNDLLAYDEYWYRDVREQTILSDSKTGEIVEWEGSKESLDAFLEAYPQIIKSTTIVPTVRLAQVVNGKVLYHGPNPLGIDRYPFVAFLGYYEPEIPYFPWRVQGMVRGLRDAQFLYNRRKVIELDILESQVNSGYKYKVDSLVNPKDIFIEGQGKGIALKKNADMMDVEKIQPAQIPPSMIQLSEILGREVHEISGVNEELLGMATDDKPGILSMLRQGAGLTTLQQLFDQLDSSVKQLGSIYLQLIQKHFSVGKIARIIGEQPTPHFSKESFAKFDVEIEEGLNTSTQKQLRFAQLLQMRELGIPITGKDLLEAATFQDKDSIMENVAKAEESQSQAAQQQQQLQMVMLQEQIKAMESKSLADQGLGVERLSRVQENRALAIERLAEAKKDRQLAILDTTKALKELEDMDINQIEKLLNMIEFVKERTARASSPAAEAKEREVEEDFTPNAALAG